MRIQKMYPKDLQLSGFWLYPTYEEARDVKEMLMLQYPDAEVVTYGSRLWAIQRNKTGPFYGPKGFVS